MGGWAGQGQKASAAVSKHGTAETVLREEKYLVQALEEMDCQVESHPKGRGSIPITRINTLVSIPLKRDRGLTAMPDLRNSP